MVVATRQSESIHSNGRLLDEDKINRALDNASRLGAEYAEIRLVSQTTNSASLKDGKLERAIPGQEIGITMRILADGAWGCLLYTSPSPRDVEESRMPSSA